MKVADRTPIIPTGPAGWILHSLSQTLQAIAGGRSGGFDGGPYSRSSVIHASFPWTARRLMALGVHDSSHAKFALPPG